MNRSRQLSAALNTFYANPVAKVSLELFFTIGLVLFLAFFAIQPTLLTMSDLIKEIDDKKALDSQMGKKIAALYSAQAEYAAVSNQLYVLEQAIPTQPSIVSDLKVIEKIATDSKVIVSSLAVIELPETVLEGTDFSQLVRRTIPIRINITGDYASIRQFVEALLNNRRVFVTDSITFAVQEEANNKSLRATISIQIPYYGLNNGDPTNESE